MPYTSGRVLVIELTFDLRLSSMLCSLGVLRGGGGLLRGMDCNEIHSNFYPLR